MSTNHTYWSCWSSSTSSTIPGPSIYTAGTTYPLSPAAIPYQSDQRSPADPIPLSPYHIIAYPDVSLPRRETSPLEPLIAYPDVSLPRRETSPLEPLKFDFDWKPKPAKKILRKPLRMIRIREDA